MDTNFPPNPPPPPNTHTHTLTQADHVHMCWGTLYAPHSAHPNFLFFIIAIASQVDAIISHYDYYLNAIIRVFCTLQFQNAWQNKQVQNKITGQKMERRGEAKRIVITTTKTTTTTKEKSETKLKPLSFEKCGTVTISRGFEIAS